MWLSIRGVVPAPRRSCVSKPIAPSISRTFNNFRIAANRRGIYLAPPTARYCTFSSNITNKEGSNETAVKEESSARRALSSDGIDMGVASLALDQKNGDLDASESWTKTAAVSTGNSMLLSTLASAASSESAPSTLVQMDLRALQQLVAQLAQQQQHQHQIPSHNDPHREHQIVGLHSPSILPRIDRKLIQSQKKCVVNIEQNITHNLNSEKVGVFSGTGFIVNAKEGIIATNYHIVGSGPQQVKITFENGESTEANVLYYDCWHDFAFYKIDPKSISFELQEAKFGSSFTLEEQAEVFLIGNNESQEYSVKMGTVTNLAINSGKRHSFCLQTSFDRTGGSSGSPIFDNQGRVVAIHTSGSNTTSFELRIEYVKDALDQLLSAGFQGNMVKRGDIGVELDLIRISDATLHFNFPQEVLNEIKVLRPEQKYIAHVHKLVPLATAATHLRPGDMIWKVDGQTIGDNLYLFDKLVDAKVGQSVEVTVIRNGQTVTSSIPITDVEKEKVKKFALFAGGVFHDTSLLIREKFEVFSQGVFLSHVNKGSCLSGLGSEAKDQPMSYATVIEEISG